MPCEAAIALPDRPSARSCNTSFALIFRTIPDHSFRHVPYTRGGRSLWRWPQAHRHWPPSPLHPNPHTGPRTHYRWTPAKRIFVKTTGDARSLDEAALARARRLAGLKGYVTNIPAELMAAGEV